MKTESKEVVPQTSAAGKPKVLSGTHPGMGGLKSKVGVYRCLLRRVSHKKNPDHADYKGVLPIANGRASVLLWLHSDGTLGLRLEKIPEKSSGKAVTK